jgi:hypothetical protein
MCRPRVNTVTRHQLVDSDSAARIFTCTRPAQLIRQKNSATATKIDVALAADLRKGHLLFLSQFLNLSLLICLENCLFHSVKIVVIIFVRACDRHLCCFCYFHLYCHYHITVLVILNMLSIVIIICIAASTTPSLPPRSSYLFAQSDLLLFYLSPAGSFCCLPPHHHNKNLNLHHHRTPRYPHLLKQRIQLRSILPQSLV